MTAIIDSEVYEAYVAPAGEPYPSPYEVPAGRWALVGARGTQAEGAGRVVLCRELIEHPLHREGTEPRAVEIKPHFYVQFPSILVPDATVGTERALLVRDKQEEGIVSDWRIPRAELIRADGAQIWGALEPDSGDAVSVVEAEEDAIGD